MSITSTIGSVVATQDEQIGLSTLFTVTPESNDPAYLIISGLDRNEYTAGYNTTNMGSLSGSGASQHFTSAGSDAWSVGIVFAYQASTGRYFNTTYGYSDQLTYTASSNINDNVSLSVYATNNLSLANAYAASPYALEQDPRDFSYLASVSIVTQPSFAGPVATQATPDSICAVAQSFVGKAWNQDGCWVLTSNISAEAGASLSASSTLVGVPGTGNGEWIVAYNGPVSANANWELNVTAGEMVGFVTTGGGGHITTVVSGSGVSARLIDNITYVNGNGSIMNAANDGSANDIIVAAAHAATQEFNGVNPNDVVVYELDTPTVSALVASMTMAEQASQSLAPLFNASNPVGSQAITEWQIYDTNTNDAITLGGVTQSAAHSVATAATATSLSTVALLTGATAGSDTIDVRAYNGSYWGDWQTLGVTVTGTAGTAPPTAPTVTDQTANQIWAQGQKVNFTLPGDTFSDPQSQTLSYTARQSSGQLLPAWLSFNASTRTFSGTVPTGVASLTLRVTATDSGGLSNAETFDVTVPAAAPIVTGQTANQTWLQGQKISLALPAKAFTDPQGQTLSYTASQSNGQALPSWLSFNATTKTFSGTVPTSGMVSLSLTVTATDTSGASAADTFGVTIPTAAAPIVTAQTTHQTWLQGQKISLALPAKAFTDPQNQALTYTAGQSNGQALPSWLSFSAATKTFTGTVPTTDVDGLTLKVTATDASGVSTSETFSVTVPAAVAPIVTGQTANQTWLQGQKISLALPVKTFTDPQNQALIYTASESNGQALPSWLSFNAATHTFAGTVPISGMASLILQVTATDASSMSTTETFGVTVPAATAPTVTGQTANQIWLQGQKISLALPAKTFTDPQNETLAYSVSQSNGEALPSWLSFNGATHTLSGTVPTGMASMSLKVTATDASSLSVSETFSVTIPAAAPNVTHQTAGQTWTQGQTISLMLPANTFTDPQNETLSYTASQSKGQALPSWLNFNASTDTFSGTVPVGMESLTLKVTASNTSFLAGSETFAVIVPAAAPAVTDQTASQSWTQGQKFSLVLPANTFTDPQNQALTYTASQSNGLALPSWLSFSAATRTFSGTAPASTANLTLKVTASDTSRLAASETFGVSVSASVGAGITSSGNTITISASHAVIDPGVGSYKMQFLPGTSGDTVVAHAGGSDEISGFNIGAGDAVDLRSLIAEMHLNPVTVAANIASYVTVADQGANVDLLFDPSGHHGGSLVAILDNSSSTITGLADLTSHGALRFS